MDKPLTPWTRKVLVIVGAIVLSSLSVLASTRFHRDPPPAPADAPGMKVGKAGVDLLPEAPQWKMLQVEEAVIAKDHWTDPVPARVKINESRATKLGAPLDGRVTSVYVELGDKVKAGQPLYTVASPNIAELRAELEKAQVDLAVAKSQLDRVQAMVAANSLPAKEEVVARQQFRQAQVALKLAGAKLNALRVTSGTDNEFTVTAPTDGVLVEKDVTSGQEVGPDNGGPLATIADLSSVWVVADLFEADAVDIHAGAVAEITSPSLPDVHLSGVVEMVSSVVDPVRHTVPIRVHLQNPEGLLRPNVYANVKFETHPRAGTVEIPASSLVSDGQSQSVFVQVDAGRFRRRAVVSGSAHGGVVPIFQGLKAGDAVVTEGAILLDNEIALAE